MKFLHGLLFENVFFFKVGVTKNNNKIASEEDSYTREALMQELEEMGEERKKLVLQLGEKNGQLSTLKNEIAKLKVCM